MHTIFGTDGIRGSFGKSWFTPSGIYAIGHAIAHHVMSHHNTPITIALATDTRASRHAVMATLNSALTLYPISIIDYGVLPTPGFVAILRRREHTCGIMITASHNKHPDTGIKIFGPSGNKISRTEENAISTHVHNAHNTPALYEYYTALHNRMSFATYTHDDTGVDEYCDFLLRQSNPDLRGITIVIDTAAGATHPIAHDVLTSCGAHVITASPQPDGYCINHDCGSTHPDRLQRYVTAYRAHVGFAFDGDGDRVIAINQHGTIKDGDDILAILLQHPAYADVSEVVGTHMSNMGLDDFLSHAGKRLVRTKVGDAHVAAELSDPERRIGGEPSGHILLTDLHTTGDGILTALRTLEVLITHHDWDLHSFTKYTQLMYTIPVQKRISLHEQPLRDILSSGHDQLQGRVYARYSGTEPVMRILVESKHSEQAYNVGSQVYHEVSQTIGSICEE